MTDMTTTVTQPAVTRAAQRDVRPQLTILGGQLTAGLGNLAFAVLMARMLRPAEYASMATFLALFIVVALPAAALTAAGALAPDRLARLAPAMTFGGAVAGLMIAALCIPLGGLLGLPAGLIVALGIAVPGSVLLNLRRGVAYGREEHRRVTGSLLLEPAVRLVAGTALGAAFGVVGAAFGTVIGGYAALAAIGTGLRPVAREASSDTAGQTAFSPAAVRSAGAAFVGLAVLQTIDLVAANRALAAPAAAEFGVLSTIGGAAFFATATIPLVLMPAAARGRPHVGGTAAAMTAVVGVAIAAGGALIARPLVHHAFGADYVRIAPLVGPYLLAMALLGLIRLQIARRAATGAALARTIVVTLAAVAVELVAITLWAQSVEAVVATTLFTTAGLATVLELPRARSARHHPGAPSDRRSDGGHGRPVRPRRHRTRGDQPRAVGRRGHQRQPGQASIRRDDPPADVDRRPPPLHHAVLWVTVRLLGASEFAVRLPSLLAGVALVPALYWVGSVIYDKRTGWVAALLASIAPFCVWYSQEARMYAIFMLLATLAVGAVVQAIRLGTTAWWVVYGVLTGLLLWTQYFAILPVIVQQAAIAWVLWRHRHDVQRRRSLVFGWFVSFAVVLLIVTPMLPLLVDQMRAYGQRTEALVPGQAGLGSSSFGGGISIYAVGANFIWALLGYHADGAMVQIAALWPLLLLLALMMLGRGRSGHSVLLLALVVVPLAALFAVGSVKRDLFELRYFSGAVPVMLLLVARMVTSTTVRRSASVIATSVLMALMLAGLVDQQVNGANPRVYDFQGAFDRIAEQAEPGDVVLYEPVYLAAVAEYYAPDIESRPVGAKVPAGAGVWVVATDRVVNAEDTAARLGTELAHLERDRAVVDSFDRPNVRVWELR